ncbi:MAG: hypothetical protein ABSH22_08990, partial [Tepidisphaeraceae bacterium]
MNEPVDPIEVVTRQLELLLLGYGFNFYRAENQTWKGPDAVTSLQTILDRWDTAVRARQDLMEVQAYRSRKKRARNLSGVGAVRALTIRHRNPRISPSPCPGR